MLELFAAVSQIVHSATIVIIMAILLLTVGMSIFLYKIVFKGDFFSSYDKNL